MTAVREAFALPLAFLTVVLMGGIRLTTPLAILPPTLFSLVLASVVMAVFVQSGTLDPSRLVHPERSSWANVNGLLAIVALFLANAQVISRLTPDTGLPALAVSVLFLVTLLQLAAAALDRLRCLRVWGVTLLSAFVLKFIVIAALAGPANRPLARALQALVDGITFGSFSQPAERSAAGYLSFAMLSVYLVGLVLLPALQRHALVARQRRIKRKETGIRRQETGDRGQDLGERT
jgi:hypothetical protein